MQITLNCCGIQHHACFLSTRTCTCINAQRLGVCMHGPVSIVERHFLNKHKAGKMENGLGEGWKVIAKGHPSPPSNGPGAELEKECYHQTIERNTTQSLLVLFPVHLWEGNTVPEHASTLHWPCYSTSNHTQYSVKMVKTSTKWTRACYITCTVGLNVQFRNAKTGV